MDSSLQAAHLGVQVDTIPDDAKFIQDFLEPCLPYSLPLLRRCQSHTKQKHLTPSAEVCLITCSTISDTNSPKARNSISSNHETEIFDKRPWLAAYIDLTNSGQTQIWTFASWEVDFGKESNPAKAVLASPGYPAYKILFDTLLRRIQTEHISKLSHDPPEQWQRLKLEGKRISEPFSRSKILFGTIAECLWPFLSHCHIAREDKSYLKYIVTSQTQAHHEPTTPPNLHFAKIPEQHLQTIIDRTDIPRTIESIRQLPNIGLFDEHNVPVAWGFLSNDGSISSLHTEPEYRGRGLAELVARQLILEQKVFYPDTENGTGDSLPSDSVAEAVIYSDANVSVGNLASRRVMEKIGGEVMWKVAWVEIDLGEP